MNLQDNAACINPTILLQAVAGDENAFRELMDTFLRTAPPLAERLEKTVLANDVDAILKASHAMRGTSSLVGAERLTGIIQALESQGRQMDLGSLRSSLALALAEFARVLEEASLYAHGALRPVA